MSSTEETATKTTLEQVEQEITQIDQIIHSWSDGRILRFDRPHVSPTVEPPGKNPQEAVKGLQNSCRVAFQVNLAVLLGVIGLAAAHATLALVTARMFGLILTAVVVLVAGFNLVQAVYSRGVTGKLLNRENQAQKSHVKPNSLRSNV